MGIVYFIVLLSVVVLIHEIGHLLTAKMFKVYCYEFSIGMGPKLIQKKFKETVYSIRALPIGGFVAMAGEKEEEKELYPDIEVPENRSLKSIKPWQKIVIMFAGVFMNFVLCFIIVAGLLLNAKTYYTAPLPIVASVVKDSVADQAGFQENDKIIKVEFADGTVIVPENYYDILVFSLTYPDEVTYTVQRDAKVLSLKVKGVLNPENNYYYIGIGLPDKTAHKVSLANVIPYTYDYIADSLDDLFAGIKRMFHGNGLDQMSGPVGIYTITKQQAELGLTNYLSLMAMISLNLGIFNLFPIPILDGGRIVITLIEWIKGSPINKKLEATIMYIGVGMLLMLMLFATYQDILKFIL